MAIYDFTRPPPELSSFYPIGRETETKTGTRQIPGVTRTATRTLAGPTTAAEEAAVASAYAGIDPSTFGRVSDADMAALRSAYETSVFGKSDAAVNAMAAEAGAAPTGAGNVAALRALTRSTAALPLAEIDYRNRAGGATAWGNLAMQRALERYRALTQGRTETYSDVTEGRTETSTDTREGIKYGLPSASVQQPGGGGSGGGVGGGTVGGSKIGASADDSWWARNPFDPYAGGGGGANLQPEWIGAPPTGAYTDEFRGPGGYGSITPTESRYTDESLGPGGYGAITPTPSPLQEAESDYARRWRERHERGDVGF